MNKIYQDCIEKATAISEGIARNTSELASKGYDTSIAQSLASLASRLKTEAEKYDEINEAATAQRQKCHELLDQLKAIVTESKVGIKSRYDQPAWQRFGLPDKK
ncbi:MAG: hypothetical protein LIO90_07760 [Bacteroidales bacterium]|nr:hypothetical protein [Bacteroidales bacterium]